MFAGVSRKRLTASDNSPSAGGSSHYSGGVKEYRMSFRMGSVKNSTVE